MTPRSTISRQIQCVQREINMRERVYPKQIAIGRMSKEQADSEIATMKDVLYTLHLAERAHLDKPFNHPDNF